ncbi:MAG: hypothetical protein H0X45_11775 [Planctomycetes bacterium]|nr:hypothetical protein [Planctomycetota bacterium]
MGGYLAWSWFLPPERRAGALRASYAREIATIDALVASRNWNSVSPAALNTDGAIRRVAIRTGVNSQSVLCDDLEAVVESKFVKMGEVERRSITTRSGTVIETVALYQRTVDAAGNPLAYEIVFDVARLQR